MYFIDMQKQVTLISVNIDCLLITYNTCTNGVNSHMNCLAVIISHAQYFSFSRSLTTSYPGI